jgi:uncharacterized protein
MSIRRKKEVAEDYGPPSDELEVIIASICQYESALIAFSGGVDSSVAAALAKRALGDDAVAVTIDNGALRDGEIEQAVATANAIGIRHVSITLDLWDISEVTQNDPERCYYCKKLVFGALRSLADQLRLNVVMDGTNASDLEGHRPGLKALRELGIVSPLLDFTKDEVRDFARNLGLTNADAPSAACLLTSFPYGTVITPGRVERLRDAERAVRTLGIAKVKIRDHNDFARIEVDREEVDKVITHASAIAEQFIGLGFTYVTLDLQWLRSGSMDIVLDKESSRMRDAHSAVHEKLEGRPA